MRSPCLALALLLGVSCASTRLPAPAALQRARVAASYSARLRVSLQGPELRARTAVLLAFQRPDALRIELPGPTGARLLAVSRQGALTAVFPSQRAVHRSRADAAALGALLGVALQPSEVMDLLTGTGSPRLRAYSVEWGPALPRKLRATLPDGARLRVTIEDPRIEERLPARAFEEPPSDGFREIGAEEARGLWGAR